MNSNHENPIPSTYQTKMEDFSEKLLYSFGGVAISFTTGLGFLMTAYSTYMVGLKDILYLGAFLSFSIGFILSFIFGGFVLLNVIESSRPRPTYESIATSPQLMRFLSTTLVQPLTWLPSPPAKCAPTAPLPLLGRRT